MTGQTKEEKTMTQEEKARAYDEALEVMRQWIAPCHTKEQLDTLKKSVFPELAGSEDESTRKALIETVKCIYDGDTMFLSEQQRDRYLAWLEKQKENPKSSDSIPSDCTSDAKCEDRWHKVTDSLPDNGRLVLAKDCLGNVLLARYDGENWEVNVYDNEDHYCHNSISKWCEIPSEKQKEQKPELPKPHKGDDTNPYDMSVSEAQEYAIKRGFGVPFNDGEVYVDERHITQTIGNILRWADEHPKEQKPWKVGANAYFTPEQKPAEWSEEDEEMINGCIHAIEYELIDNGQDEQVATDPRITFLKSIRLQPKQEWSDTNELVFQDICKHLKEEGCGGWVLFLKALRNGEFQPKQEWSEEQIKKIRSEEYTKGFNDAAFGGKLKEWSVEDEDRIRQIERIAQQAGCTQKLQEEIHNWLKSLRPSWKPSEEQMEALKCAVEDVAKFSKRGGRQVELENEPYYSALHSLYCNLEKLM